MKQSFFLGSLVFLTSFNIFAAGLKNPLQRICLQSGGQFWIYGAGEIQQYPVCRFGQAEIGALDLVRATNGEYLSSVSGFLNSAAVPPNRRSCVDFNGSLKQVEDTSGTQNLLCVFTDGSMISRETLTWGSADPRTQQLKLTLESL